MNIFLNTNFRLSVAAILKNGFSFGNDARRDKAMPRAHKKVSWKLVAPL